MLFLNFTHQKKYNIEADEQAIDARKFHYLIGFTISLIFDE
jgi:hypothetical protein